jgi:hypothetical protein
MGDHGPETPEDDFRAFGEALNLDSAEADPRPLGDIPLHVAVSGEQDKKPGWVEHLEAVQGAHTDRSDLDGVSERAVRRRDRGAQLGCQGAKGGPPPPSSPGAHQ